jgi:hypothetical protein
MYAWRSILAGSKWTQIIAGFDQLKSGRETMSEEHQSDQDQQAKDDSADVKAILVMFTAAVLFAAVFISGFTVDL